LVNVEQDLRERLVKVGQMAWDANLVSGSGGNISARVPGTTTCLIKPSRYRFCDLKPEDFVIVDINTRKLVKGDRKPSVEVPFHTMMYKKREDVGGVVHTHSHYAVLLGIAGVDLVPIGMRIRRTPSLAKGVRIAGYAPAGSEELARNVEKSIGEGCAVLLQHHGVLAIGKTIEEAYEIASATEGLAKLQYEVMQIGRPVSLPKSAINSIIERGKERGAII
jgi:ribulose-5-phosphate 4-epimerase/fuculose-1-phosphate aldolase